MKTIIIEIDGIVSTGRAFAAARDDAARRALHASGIRVTAHEFSATLELTRAAMAEDPTVSAMWRLHNGIMRAQGADAEDIERAWERLHAHWQSLAGYRFTLNPDARRLLEEVRFNAVDCWGDVPMLAAVGRGGAMVRDALEHARLLPLFDHVVLSDEVPWRPSDARFLMSLCEQWSVAPQACLFAGISIGCFLGKAREVGMFAVQVRADIDNGMPSRGPWEEPMVVVDSLNTLGNVMLDWINAPVRAGARGVRS